MYLSTGARYVGPVGVPVGGDLSRYLKELFKNSREGDGIYPILNKCSTSGSAFSLILIESVSNRDSDMI